MIQLKNVTVQLQNTFSWNTLDLTFENGVNYFIQGRNGCGKTTLLRLLAGQLQPRSGTVHYDFIPEAGEWEEKYQLRKRYLHFIPAHALHELLRAPEFYYQQRYYTIEEDPTQTVREYLGERLQNLSSIGFPDSFRIDALLNLKLTRLSNGQIKKVIILKQLLDSIPRILLLDYPFEGLDAGSRLDLSNFLDHLSSEQGVQLIVADHDDSRLLKSVSKIIQLDGPHVAILSRSESSTEPSVPTEIPSSKSTSNEPVLEMRDLTIRYGKKEIISNFNWTIRKGERWALTGRNGSGKTTLFSLIYADHPMAYSEEVFLFGKRRGTGESIWDIKRRISYLGPEQFHFLDPTTTNLSVLQFLQSVNSSEVRRITDFFDTASWLDRKLKFLSHGELQLVLLMSLFLQTREMLLLDEPFQFLDTVRKQQVTQYLQSALDSNTTLVLITHYEADVSQWTNLRMRLP